MHGRIGKAGRAQAGGVLVEADWSASHASGPLRAFYRRIKARCGFQTAIVATAPPVAASHPAGGWSCSPRKCGTTVSPATL